MYDFVYKKIIKQQFYAFMFQVLSLYEFYKVLFFLIQK